MNSYIGVLLSKLLKDKVRNGEIEYIKEARDKYEVLEYHFENEYPEKLLITQHPSEEPWMREYRKRRWQSPTMVATGRVYQFLQKIQQADDFKIRWETLFEKTGIAEEVNGYDNTLKNYCTKKLPLYGSLDSWLFNSFLKCYLSDPNGIVIVLPTLEDFIENPNEVLQLNWEKPYPQIFGVEDVLYEGEDWVLVEVEEWKDKNSREWKQYIAVTLEGIVLFRQIGPFTDASPFQVYEIPFQFEHLPVIKVGNVVYEEEDGHLVYDSVLTPCLPAWNEVLYRTDDLNILFAIHALPQKWALKLSSCKTCNGTGFGSNASKQKVECRDCNGSGRASSTPFSLIEVNVDRSTAINPAPSLPPLPPAGYIERPVDAVKLFQEDIVYKEYQGFKAIGLEILGQIPSSQSGIAKEYDRKELNTFCYSVCVHLATIYKTATYHILCQRYQPLIQSGILTEERKQISIPVLTIPTDFDVLTSSVVSDMLAKATAGKFNPLIIHGIEIDYVEKLYGENSKQKSYLKLITDLDPLPFKNIDEKTLLLTSNGCSKRDYILSANLTAFLTKLINENPDWVALPFDIQLMDVTAMAEAKMGEINAGIVPLMQDTAPVMDAPVDAPASISLDRLPLAVMQLSLAAQRAKDSGNDAIAKTVTDKLNALLNKIA
jgi:hypothetical protein